MVQRGCHSLSRTTGLQRRPGGIYYLRRAVPRDLRVIFGRGEIVRSLGTANHAEARSAFAREWHSLDDKFNQAREANVQRSEGAALTAEQLDGLTASYFTDLDRRLSEQLGRHSPEDIGEYVQLLRQEIDDYRVSNDECRHVQPVAVQLLQNANRSDLVGQPSFWTLCHRLNDAYIEALERQCHRVSGRRDPTLSFTWLEGGERSNNPSVNPQRGVGVQSRSGSGMTLAAVIDAHDSDPSRRANERTRTHNATTMRALTEVVGPETHIADVTRSDVTAVRDLLLRTPCNATQRYQGLTLAAAAEREARLANPRTLDRSTVNTQINWVTGLFAFAVREQFVGSNPAQRLSLPLIGDRTNKREVWKPAELNRLFCQPIYSGCQDGDRNWKNTGNARPRQGRFWVPLLCLFQGLRMNEACRLYADDLSSEGEIWILRVAHNPERNQRVKNDTTASVPLHPMLIDLGFPTFAQQNGSELFPELRLDRNGYASNYFSKWFVALQKAAGVRRKGLHFHSFRHNFRDALRQARVPMDRSHALGRWSDGGSAAERYGEGFRPVDLMDDISGVQYPGLDISHLIR